MVINGKQIADEVLKELKDTMVSKNLKLRLAAVLACPEGIEGLGLKKFVELKGKAAEKIGVVFSVYQFSEKITTEELAQRIREITAIADGVLVELPLPKHINSSEVLNEIPVEKDVDVLSSASQHRFYKNLEAKLPLGRLASKWIFPPAVEALKIVLEKYNIDLKGKKTAVFGQGALVGKPISHWLEQEGSEVSRIRSKTKDPEKLSQKADIIVTGVGKPGLIKGYMIKDGAVVIDFGYGKNAEDKMTGDVDFNSVSAKTSLITPVPGGMGPVLIVAVLKNLVVLNS